LGISDSVALLDLVVAGHGVGLGRSSLARDHLAAGRLVRPFDVIRPTEFSHFAVAPKASVDEPKVKAFFDWILEEVEHDGR